jgi:hypothetical protein
MDSANFVCVPTMSGPCMEVWGIAVPESVPIKLGTLFPFYIFFFQNVINLLLQPPNFLQII